MDFLGKTERPVGGQRRLAIGGFRRFDVGWRRANELLQLGQKGLPATTDPKLRKIALD